MFEPENPRRQQQRSKRSQLEKRKSLSISSVLEMMSQSTIYYQHEARRYRTLQLKNDPRPAILRVLSGLPLFRMMVLPYEPEVLPGTVLLHATTTSPQFDGANHFPDPSIFSQPTLENPFETSMVSGSNTSSSPKQYSRSYAFMVGCSALATSTVAFGMMRRLMTTSSSSTTYLTNSVAAHTGSGGPMVAVPLFTPTNSAAVAFLKPASQRALRSSHRVRMIGVPIQTIILVSFLSFVGYRNYAHQKTLAESEAQEE